MLTVIYDPMYGNVVPDGHVDAFVNEVLSRMCDDDMVTVGSELIVDTFRLRVAQGEFPHKQIEFMFNEQIIKVSPTGKIKDWPRGFCDYNINVKMKLLDLQMRHPKPYES